MHDFGARLLCLVDSFSQVSDLNAYRVASNVVIKVHVEEVAGHRRAPYGKSMLRRRRETRLKALYEESASVVYEWQSGRDRAS